MPKGLQGMTRLFCWFALSRTKAAGMEYGLIAFGISVAIVVSIASLGSDLNAGFSTGEIGFQ
jgi:Flp pilus assembly pilin Flp